MSVLRTGVPTVLSKITAKTRLCERYNARPQHSAQTVYCDFWKYSMLFPELVRHAKQMVPIRFGLVKMTSMAIIIH